MLVLLLLVTTEAVCRRYFTFFFDLPGKPYVRVLSVKVLVIIVDLVFVYSGIKASSTLLKRYQNLLGLCDMHYVFYRPQSGNSHMKGAGMRVGNLELNP